MEASHLCAPSAWYPRPSSIGRVAQWLRYALRGRVHIPHVSSLHRGGCYAREGRHDFNREQRRVCRLPPFPSDLTPFRRVQQFFRRHYLRSSGCPHHLPMVRRTTRFSTSRYISCRSSCLCGMQHSFGSPITVGERSTCNRHALASCHGWQ